MKRFTPASTRAPPPHRQLAAVACFCRGQSTWVICQILFIFSPPIIKHQFVERRRKGRVSFLLPIWASVGNLWRVCGEPECFWPCSRKSSPLITVQNWATMIPHAPKKIGEKNHSTITKQSTRGWNVTGSRVISLFPWPFIALQTAWAPLKILEITWHFRNT